MGQRGSRRAWRVAAAGILVAGVWAADAPASRADPTNVGAWVVPQHGDLSYDHPTLVAGLNGNEWLDDSTSAGRQPELQQVTPAGVFSVLPAQFEHGSSGPVAMVDDAGDVWALDSAGPLDEIEATGAGIGSFATTAAAGSGNEVTDLTTGPDGDLYVAAPAENDNSPGSIDQLTTSGTEHVIPLPRMADFDYAEPRALAVLGNTVFFADGAANGEIDSVTSTGVTGGPYPGVSSSLGPESMVTGPDGDLWVITASGQDDSPGDDVEQISPAGALVHDYAIGEGPLAGITIGSDGQLWFAEPDRESLGAIDPATGAVTNLTLGLDTNHEVTFPEQIAAGSDDTIWYLGLDQSSAPVIGEVSLTGAPPAPRLEPVEGISPNPLPSWSTVAGFSSVPQVLTISNTGQADLSTATPLFTGADPVDFSVTASTCSGTVAPGASCQITLVFTPHGLGARSASLQIATNDAVNGPLTVALSGTGLFVPPPPVPISTGGPPVSGGGSPPAGLIVAGRLSFAGTSKAATVSRSGTVSLPLACSSAGRCVGTARLTTTIATAAHHPTRRSTGHATRRTRRTLTLGTRHYALNAGAHAHVLIHLSKRGQRLLEAAPDHRLKVVVRLVDGSDQTLTRPLSLRTRTVRRARH